MWKLVWIFPPPSPLPGLWNALLRRLRNELLIMPRELLLTLDPLALEQAMDRAAGQLLLVDGGEPAATAP